MGKPAYFTEGMRAYRRGDYSAAVESLGALADRDDLPGKLARYYCAMAHRAMGVESLEAGEFSAAAEHLRQAVALIGNKAELVEYLRVAVQLTYEELAEFRKVEDSGQPESSESLH